MSMPPLGTSLCAMAAKKRLKRRESWPKLCGDEQWASSGIQQLPEDVP
jgi:hypothetical protein